MTIFLPDTPCRLLTWPFSVVNIDTRNVEQFDQTDNLNWIQNQRQQMALLAPNSPKSSRKALKPWGVSLTSGWRLCFHPQPVFGCAKQKIKRSSKRQVWGQKNQRGGASFGFQASHASRASDASAFAKLASSCSPTGTPFVYAAKSIRTNTLPEESVVVTVDAG